jgi:methylthioribose-1-phosphate isomerase
VDRPRPGPVGHRAQRDARGPGLTELPPDLIPPTIEWAGDRVRLIDQRVLPRRLEVVEAQTVDALCDYISTLAVRGAPALGAAGAMGVALAHVRGEDLAVAAEQLIATRPTAVNLAWGARRALAAADPVAEALAIALDDVERCRAIGRHGAGLVPVDGRVLTHCNAGGLATVGYGTALGVIRGAHEAGRRPRVWVDETRPLLQGARLTAWELDRLGIEHTLVVDSVAGSLMAEGLVDLVVVGADRIAANGDVANKIGTYTLAVLAHHHSVPFYVAAPRSTFDADCPSGADIQVERRDAEEVSVMAGTRVAPEGVAVENRAFDVTPAALVTSYVTEVGVGDHP